MTTAQKIEGGGEFTLECCPTNFGKFHAMLVQSLQNIRQCSQLDL